MIYLLWWQLKLAKEEKIVVQADEASAAQQREQLNYVQVELAAKGDQLKDLEGQLAALHSEIAAKEQRVNDSITREQDARAEIRRLVGVTENMVRVQEKDSKYMQELHETDKQNMVIPNRVISQQMTVCAQVTNLLCDLENAQADAHELARQAMIREQQLKKDVSRSAAEVQAASDAIIALVICSASLKQINRAMIASEADCTSDAIIALLKHSAQLRSSRSPER